MENSEILIFVIFLLWKGNFFFFEKGHVSAWPRILIWPKLTFMGTLQVRTKWNYQSWIQIFQIKFLFLVLSFWKHIALVYFLRTDWSHTFLKVKNSNQNFNLKESFEMFEIWIFMGWKWPLRTLWRILHMFLDILKFTVENKKKLLRENCFENVVSEFNKKWFKSPQIYFFLKVRKLKN